jgi:chromosome segregation protein
MRLRSLTLQGFKSFADKTELHFHEGITAIVGPNGCGKSNISDAIRWVLGEQKPSAIRGSRMEEAIFQGTVQRRALNRAEVALTFSNEEGRLPVPQKEVEIRRTVFREGGSDYEMNRQATRLRDILDLCRDTGLGANAYTVIEQGMVDAILSDRAEERRHLFEEAAGIGRYKDRRKSALRRLEAAEQDLARLQDVVGEVETKVRSLARQRRRAERYTDMRARRLGLEIAVASVELDEIEQSLAEAEARLESLASGDPAARAELSTAEAALEKRRLESTELGRQRSEAATRLETTNRRIADVERAVAVAAERHDHAERRLRQIALEREDVRSRLQQGERDLASLEVERTGQQGVVESLAERVTEVQKRHADIRHEVTRLRRIDEDRRGREAEMARRLSALEAEAARAESREREAAERLDQLDLEQNELSAEARRLDEQGDLFAEQARELAARQKALAARRQAVQAELAELLDADKAVRADLAAAEEDASLQAGKADALERLQRDFQGFAPAVAAVLAARNEVTGLVGPVADLVRLEPERAAAAEAAIGSLLQAVVVEDTDAAHALRDWIAEHHPERGAIALLPRAALARLEALLAEVQFAGQAPAEPVLVGRKERLAAQREAADLARAKVEDISSKRSEISGRISAVENNLKALISTAHEVDLELRRMAADEDTRAGQRGRAERALAEVERRRAELERSRSEASSAGERARSEHAELESEIVSHRSEWQEAAVSLSEAEAAWEKVRDEEAELRVSHARAEGSLGAVERRIGGAREELERLGSRRTALDAEEQEQTSARAESERIRTEGGSDLTGLFEERDAVTVALRGLEDRLAEAGQAAIGLEARVRGLRRTAEETSERRHRLELQRAESVAAARRIRDRLEAEWARPFEQLLEEASDVEGDPESLRSELLSLAADIERLGPINMLAMEEYEEERQRLEFLTSQRDDLVKARDDLQSAIRQINRTARQLFTDVFEQIRMRFQQTFQTLFEGGECDIRLEDPDDPLETVIDITASPRGKRTQRIHLLSGGERALTALALLFAIYLVKPSPFCVLDEVDAPLDEANIGRFIAMLTEFKAGTQFIVITHNPRTMESADWLYGVTMEEAGVSSIVGVHLEEVLATAAAGA